MLRSYLWTAKNWHALGFAALVACVANACGGGDEFQAQTTTDSGKVGSGGGGTGGGAGTSEAGGALGSGGATGGAAGMSGAAGASSDGSAGTATSDSGTDGCVDADGDGYSTCAGDCDDTNAAISPGASEICGDGIDQTCTGVADSACGGLGTFVSGNTGDDNNPGTQLLPVRTIAKGQQNATAIEAQGYVKNIAVYVAQGHYQEKVTVIERIDLLGGYNCDTTSCTWARDIITYDTAILATDDDGVLVPAGVSRTTKVDGFRIMGLGGTPLSAPGSAALSIVGSWPTITNNRIFGGTVTGGDASTSRSIGILITGASNGGVVPAPGPYIEKNTIDAGTGIQVATGIQMSAPRGWNYSTQGAAPGVIAEIKQNTIQGGTATTTLGIFADATVAGTILNDNTISGGKASTGVSWGVNFTSNLNLDSNRINSVAASAGSCTGSAWCGGIVSSSGTSVITNNIVFGAASSKSAAVRLVQVEKAAGAIVLSSNYLAGGPPAASSAAAVTVAAVVLENVGCGGSCGATTVGLIRNNVITGRGSTRYGIYEVDNATNTALTIHPKALTNNDFFLGSVSSDVLWRRWETGVVTNISLIGTVNLTLSGSGNFTGDPLEDSTFHLTSGSPCINAGTDLDSPPFDFEGDTRPMGNVYDVGPDEAQ